MSKLLIYSTKYGATLQYVEWIKQEMPDLQIISVDDLSAIKEIDIADYAKVIIASRVYMGKLGAHNFILENLENFNNEVFLCLVGAIPLTEEGGRKPIDILPEKFLSRVKGIVKLPGFTHSIPSKMLNFLEKAKARDLGREYGDGLDRKALEPIYNFIRKD